MKGLDFQTDISTAAHNTLELEHIISSMRPAITDIITEVIV